MRRRIAEDGRRAADLRGVSSQPLALLRACSARASEPWRHTTTTLGLGIG